MPAWQGEQDFRVLRKRFVPELLMALHDSALADGAARTAALAALCRAARILAAARDLALHAGAARAHGCNGTTSLLPRKCCAAQQSTELLSAL